MPLSVNCQVEYDHQQDVVYGYKDGLALVMDVYTPKTDLNSAGGITPGSLC